MATAQVVTLEIECYTLVHLNRHTNLCSLGNWVDWVVPLPVHRVNTDMDTPLYGNVTLGAGTAPRHFACVYVFLCASDVDVRVMQVQQCIEILSKTD